MPQTPVVEIIRLETTAEGTLGAVCLNKRLFCVSLEPWADKRIPPGMYLAERYDSPHFGYSVFKFEDVYDRSYIEIHPGNVSEDTSGCILLGQYPGKFHGNRAVLNSGNTFRSFMAELRDANEIIVVIKENY